MTKQRIIPSGSIIPSAAAIAADRLEMLLGFMVTTRVNNTTNWMCILVNHLNRTYEALGLPQRVHFDGLGIREQQPALDGPSTGAIGRSTGVDVQPEQKESEEKL